MNVSWAILKSFVTARSLSIQWIDLGESYALKAIDNYYILDSSVNKNTADCTDFETNFKPAGNSPLTSNGAVRVNLRNSAGTEIGVTTSTPTTSASALVVRTIPLERPTYSVTAPNIVPGNLKSMFAIKNTGTSIVRIVEIKIVNSLNTAAIGVICTFGVYRISSYTNGLAFVIPSYDTADSFTFGTISCHSGATVSGESAEVLHQCTWSSDEWTVGSQDVESADHTLQQLIPFWEQKANGTKALTIRQNEGLTIKCITNSTVGSFNISIIFTTE